VGGRRCILCKNEVHIFESFSYEKTSEKSLKYFLKSEKEPPLGRWVTLRGLKLLSNTLKVT